MKNDPDVEFRRICLHFRNLDPMVWDMFLNHVGRWTNETLVALSEAPAELIMTVKGRALQNRAYYEFFSTCDKDAKKAKKEVEEAEVTEPAPE
jgi:hypothetical protein